MIVKLLTGIDGIGDKLPDATMGKDVGKSPKDGKPSKLGKLGKFARLGKFIPGFGLAITALNGVFDGVRAGLQEAEKENCPQCGEKRHKLMACSSCGCS